MQSLSIQEQLKGLTSQATVGGVYMGDIVELRLPIPPYKDQIEISNYLDIKSARFNTLTDKATQAITLLKERRTALISAAVTGKIDVREEVG